MNKSLLLIICDFLLISILALVEFKPPEAPEEVAREEAEAESGLERDLVEVLRLSLEGEAEQRRRLAQELEARQSDLEETARELDERSRELDLTREEREQLERERERLAAERERLAREKAQTEASLAQTREERERLDVDLREQEERARRMQEELQQRQGELAQREEALSELEEIRRELERDRERVATDLRISETERAMLEQNLVAARAEVDRARIETERAQERAERLGEGVSQLAERTTAVQEEVRRAQPLSMNVIYNRFQNNRIPLTFNWQTPALFGTRDQSQTVETVLVEEGGQIYAVFEGSRSPFRAETLDRIQNIRGTMQIGDNRLEIVEVSFLRADPRVVAIAVPRRFVEDTDIEVMQLADDPLRFPEAVLINDERGYFGESRFRLRADSQRYVDMDTRLVSRLFGEFSPRRGDIVFSKSGQILGFMVTNDISVIVDEIRPWASLRVGNDFSQSEFRNLHSRLQRLGGGN